MKKFVLPLVASLLVATPALANEGRVEARGGVYWSQGYSKGTAGVAAGYDFDLANNLFVGGEVSADKILTSGTRVAFGFTGRVGAKLESNKLYVAGGYTTKPCQFCNDAVNLGLGVERNFAGGLYGKVEYRHYFVANGIPDSNAAVAGLGYKF